MTIQTKEKTKAELSIESAYPCIRVTCNCGESEWVAKFQDVNIRFNVIDNITETNPTNFDISDLENAKLVALKLAHLHINLHAEIIACGFDLDHFYCIVG